MKHVRNSESLPLLLVENVSSSDKELKAVHVHVKAQRANKKKPLVNSPEKMHQKVTKLISL